MAGYKRRPLNTYPTTFFTLARLGKGVTPEGIEVRFPQKKEAYQLRTMWYHFVAALVREKQRDLVYGAKQISVSIHQDGGEWVVNFHSCRDWHLAQPLEQALAEAGVEVREEDRVEPDRDLG